VDAADQLYGGRYRILDRLGAGGMAIVHQARDERLGRDVAVKVLARRFRQDMLAVRRFRREAELGARLSHPNVVAVLGAGSQPHPFIAMELVRGLDAAALVRERGRQPVAVALRVVAQIAAGLQHAHDRGVIHGDVSPRNILIRDHDGTAKLADLGLARTLNERAEERPGQAWGTPGFMSPEVLDGAPPSTSSDLYSLAALARVLITGRLRADPLASAPADPPHRVEEALMQALSGDPGARHGSVAEFRAQIVGHRTTAASLQVVAAERRAAA